MAWRTRYEQDDFLRSLRRMQGRKLTSALVSMLWPQSWPFVFPYRTMTRPWPQDSRIHDLNSGHRQTKRNRDVKDPLAISVVTNAVVDSDPASSAASNKTRFKIHSLGRTGTCIEGRSTYSFPAHNVQGKDLRTFPGINTRMVPLPLRSRTSPGVSLACIGIGHRLRTSPENSSAAPRSERTNGSLRLGDSTGSLPKLLKQRFPIAISFWLDLCLCPHRTYRRVAYDGSDTAAGVNVSSCPTSIDLTLPAIELPCHQHVTRRHDDPDSVDSCGDSSPRRPQDLLPVSQRGVS